MTASEIAPPPADRPRHPIAVVAQRTGLSQDLLRAWERRYAVVQPARDAGGQRLYSDADVERLRLLQLAASAGRPIAKLAALATPALAGLVEEDARARPRPAPVAPGTGADDERVARALEAARALDGRALETLLRGGLVLHGVHDFLERVASPLLVRIGQEWHDGRLSIAGEHAATAVIEGIVGDAMRTMSRDDGAPRLLVAALAGCRHSLGATLVGAAAAADGWSVVYLGADVPAEEIAEGATRSGASVVAVSAVYADDARALGAALRGLRGMLPARVELLVGGRAALGASRELAGSAIGTGATLADLRALLRTVRDRIETGRR